MPNYVTEATAVIREIPAGELADAERITRVIAERKAWHSSAPPADRMALLMAEYDRRAAVVSILRHYLGTIANRIGRPTSNPLQQVGAIEEVGEGVLAELERLRARVAELEPIKQRALELRESSYVADQRAAIYILGEA